MNESSAGRAEHETGRIAPRGFTAAQWQTFMDQGWIVIEQALTAAEVDEYLDVIDRVVRRDPNFRPDVYFEIQNMVERDPVLAGLIDHPRHVGFAYDLYGELLKVHQSQLMLRPKGQGRSSVWHTDGPRAVPYQVFSPELPLQMKIGYWLTDLPAAGMGNLVVLPGSHRQSYLDAYDSMEPMPGERPLILRRGDMTIMHGGVWHRAGINQSEQIRRNLYISYCPSWVTAADRLLSEPNWLRTLNREQRILMRSYERGWDSAKPPAEDFPLFLDRESRRDRDAGEYPERVRLHRRKRRTTAEKGVF